MEWRRSHPFGASCPPGGGCAGVHLLNPRADAWGEHFTLSPTSRSSARRPEVGPPSPPRALIPGRLPCH